jgi:hypothetical protein
VVTVTSPPQISDLIVSENAREILVQWKTDRNATCVALFGETDALGSFTPPTVGTNHQAFLTNLEPQTTYNIQIHAVTPTGSAIEYITATTELPRVVQWEAEYGNFGPHTQGFSSDQANNNAYVGSMSTNDFGAEYFVYLDRGLNYRLWTRCKVSRTNAPVSVSVNDGSLGTFYLSDDTDTNNWRWSLLTGHDHNAPIQIPFEMGWHTIAFGAPSELLIDQFTLVNDPLWTPVSGATKPVLTEERNEEGEVILTWIDPSSNATAIAIEASLDGAHFDLWGETQPMGNSIDLGIVTQPTHFRVYSHNDLDRTDYSNVVASF